MLITGGARAGKSRFAQGMAERSGDRRRLFVATAVACDGEMRSRISNHRKERNGHWRTLEEPTRLPERLPSSFLSSGGVLLFDCLPTFVTNLLMARHSHASIRRRIAALLNACRRPGLTTLFVSNEVGLGLVPDHPLGREFRDLLGIVNQQVADAADEVYLLVAGLPLRIKSAGSSRPLLTEVKA
ncbi:MAG: bifunctional adenosylcobinamide kinase/adenosylcobinamide-phosphate guanylyltransferase [Candidatus Omnitrophica bacterium]|nr:bifunctional adenosylcobinamide kinase/adenosylcobinamide-phosphate guanylyltransferase [Candidatus Omnitrophota bacterium]